MLKQSLELKRDLQAMFTELSEEKDSIGEKAWSKKVKAANKVKVRLVLLNFVEYVLEIYLCYMSFTMVML